MATKIAFVITKLDLGGAQKSVLYTARHISDNFEPFLLCGQGGTLEKYAKDHIKNLHIIPSLIRQINPVKDFLAFKELAKKLKEINPQIVHTNCPKAGILGRIAAKLFTKAKVVHTTHGFVFYEGQNIFKKYFYILIERFAALFADYMIFVSNRDLQTALKYKITTSEKARLIRAGVTPKTKESLRFNKTKLFEELGIKEGTKIILQTANLKPEKNPLESIRIANLVCKKIPNTVFLYTGAGPLKTKSENLIKEFELENNFKLIGEREDIPHLLSIADVFILTSIREGLPMALLEALFMKIPAVCYNVGGIYEVLKDGENGFLIPFNCTQKAAESIINILQGNFAFKEQSLAIMRDFDIKDMLLKQQELYTLIGDKNSLFTNI
ncbi:MAG: glycosyltransferase family 4 protein [Elusimicrobiaceae bacterium]|nr:glycosyltransferase family 4 protein [Elusimicrobiaceae bacterium]